MGAGIAGLAAAVALHKIGIPVLVLERAPCLPQAGAAIGLYTNAFRALEALGVADAMREGYPVSDRVELCAADGRLLASFSYATCRGGPHEFRGVARPALLAALASQLPANALRFDAPVRRVENAQDGSVVTTLETGEALRGRCVIGADGARSVAATALGVPPPRYAGYAAYRGIASFPQGQDVPLPDATVRVLYGAGVRAGLYRVSQRDVYWFTCFNAPEDVPQLSADERVADALASVAGWGWDMDKFILNTPPESVVRNRVTDRWLVPGSTFGAGCITLAGDAAHPMTPNLGQGGCVALEDAVVLAQRIAPAWGARDPAELAAALRGYEAERSTRAAPLTLRSNLMGAALQLPWAPVIAAREVVMSRLYPYDHFLDHAVYDCGTLPAPVASSVVAQA